MRRKSQILLSMLIDDEPRRVKQNERSFLFGTVASFSESSASLSYSSRYSASKPVWASLLKLCLKMSSLFCYSTCKSSKVKSAFKVSISELSRSWDKLTLNPSILSCEKFYLTLSFTNTPSAKTLHYIDFLFNNTVSTFSFWITGSVS
jgi:hypothetical protein